METYHDIGSDIAGTQYYDVAHVKWGESWCMPSLEQIKELFNHSTSECTNLNSVNGHKFTGNNGGCIFLPAAGYRWNGNLDRVGYGGYYWSSTKSLSDSYFAYYLYFVLGNTSWNNNCRIYGFSVRPVSR